MEILIHDNQFVEGVIAFADSKEQPTDVADGAVELIVADGTLATATYDDPTNTVRVSAVGPIGVTSLQIKATNQAGEDLPFDLISINITGGIAKTSSIKFGEPQDQS